jgi:hypothetical protein
MVLPSFQEIFSFLTSIDATCSSILSNGFAYIRVLDGRDAGHRIYWFVGQSFRSMSSASADLRNLPKSILTPTFVTGSFGKSLLSKPQAVYADRRRKTTQQQAHSPAVARNGSLSERILYIIASKSMVITWANTHESRNVSRNAPSMHGTEHLLVYIREKFHDCRSCYATLDFRLTERMMESPILSMSSSSRWQTCTERISRILPVPLSWTRTVSTLLALVSVPRNVLFVMLFLFRRRMHSLPEGVSEPPPTPK